MSSYQRIETLDIPPLPEDLIRAFQSRKGPYEFRMTEVYDRLCRQEYGDAADPLRLGLAHEFLSEFAHHQWYTDEARLLSADLSLKVYWGDDADSVRSAEHRTPAPYIFGHKLLSIAILRSLTHKETRDKMFGEIGSQASTAFFTGGSPVIVRRQPWNDPHEWLLHTYTHSWFACSRVVGL